MSGTQCNGWSSDLRRQRRLGQVVDYVADADHPDQGVIVEHRKQPDLMLVHQPQDGVEGVAGRAADQRPVEQFRDRHRQHRRTMSGKSARHVPLREDPDDGIAFGPAHVLDHQGVDVLTLHQADRHRDGLAQANGDDARAFLPQNIFHLGHGVSSLSAAACRCDRHTRTCGDRNG